MLKVTEITNKKIWDKFLEEDYKGFYPFFESWEWGEVQKKIGFEVIRIGLLDKEKLIGSVQIVKVNAKRGNYFHLRHGPILINHSVGNYTAILKYLKNLANSSNVNFIRISPLIEDTTEVNKVLNSLGFRNSPIHNMDAEICWILDITKSEDELLSQMRKSHRYLIKKSLKEEIEILQITKSDTNFEKFLGLYKKLANKRHFTMHKGLKEELDILGQSNKAVLFLAKKGGKILGGALIDFAGNMAIYHHGAIDDEYRDLNVSYLLQWVAIREAKKRGKKIYNFWGIASNESKKHPWYGLTLFKTGFGGEKKQFMHAKDLPLSPKYVLTYLIETYSRIKKGY